MSMSTSSSKVFGAVVLLLGTGWQLHYLPTFSSRDRTIFLIWITLFDVAAAIVLTIAARIKPEQGGVSVEQFGISHLGYADFLQCIIVSFFSQSFAFVTTNRRFPSSILLCQSTLDVDKDGKTERMDLMEFLRIHNPNLRTKRFA